MMAKKHLNETQRKLVLDLVNHGKTYRRVSEITNIPFTTISSIVKKFKSHGTVASLTGRGRKRKTSSKVDRTILMEVKKKRFVSTLAVSKMVENTYGIHLSSSTIRNRIRESGFHGRIVRKKPFLTRKHMMKRLEFARKYVSMPLTFWKKILWSDESKFNLRASDGIQKVWRKPGEAYSLSCMRGTVKHGGGNIMIWGCMAWNGVGKINFIDDTINSEMYINILKDNLKSSARKLRLGNNYIFQQDNDPKHTAKKTKEWFDKSHINVLEWPAQSPDLNPIEHLWAILDRKIGERAFKKKDDLKTAVSEAWESMDNVITKKLVESMPKRLSAVLTAKGGPTKY